ncbi:MAG: hypothetical protein M3Q48_05935 [Actinomycetota bacterium]|nr:hypothetical protein [Actinomycetota bacterium]
MKIRTYVAAVLVAVTALAFAPNSATAGSNQSCSQRGGNKNSVLCVANISVTDSLNNVANVKIKGNRILTDNEIKILETVIIGDIEILNICKSTRDSDIDDCIDVIIKDVTVTADAFNNYDVKGVCASWKGKSKCK